MSKKAVYRLALGLALAVAIALLVLFLNRPWIQKEQTVQASISPVSTPLDLDSYERVTGPEQLVFPRDHGPHPGYLTEWWYYTGNLAGDDGRRFGYQLTFFRRAMQPLDQRVERSSRWAADQVYMAHFAITDAASDQFYAYERFERGAAGLAGAKGEPSYEVWVRDWSVVQLSENEYLLKAAEDDVEIELHLKDDKGITLQGVNGFSQKGPETGNASLYYSQTRLVSEGSLTVGGQTYPVNGLSWLDREISTSALSQGQVGWDWFALQLSDGSELMAYNLRRSDGTVDPYSSAVWISPDGVSQLLTPGEFKIEPAGSWRSPHSGAQYPSGWDIEIPKLGLSLRADPLVDDQELNLSFTYWEGAVSFSGTRAGEAVTGYGYIELTGYAQSLEGGL
jgi:predicted secreted hydrolase